MQCGKSTALALLGAVVPRPLPSANISPAAIFRAVEKYKPTLLLDEAETYMRDGNEALRGILNSGHTRAQAFVMRVEGDSLEPRLFSTWGPKAFSLIGRLPPTLEDRSITVPMKRKARAERVERLRLDRLPAEAEPLRQRAARWAADNIGTLKNADPDIPAELVRDRARDNWRSLLAVADGLGGTWPAKARRAALALAGGRPTEDTARITLLDDIRGIFREQAVDRLPSGDLVKSLVELEDHPWPEWRDGHPLTATQLARLLKPFGIAPVKWRGEGGQRTWRGYQAADFQDSFDRYLGDGNAPPPAETPPFKPPQPPQARKQEVSAGNATATERYFVAVGKNANSLKMRRVADVAAQPGGVSRAPLDENYLEV
jgi:putative DNA primase/helicase